MHPTDLGRLPHFAFKNEWQTDSVEKEHVKIVWEQMVHVPVFPRGERCTGVTDLRSTELSRQKQCHKSLDLLAAELSRITQESAHLFSKSFPDSFNASTFLFAGESVVSKQTDEMEESERRTACISS